MSSEKVPNRNVAGVSKGGSLTNHPSEKDGAFAVLAGRPLLPNVGIPLNLDWVRDVRVNTSAVPTDVLVSFFTAGGSPIGTVTTTVPALRWTQIVRALPAGQASAFAKVQVLAGGAQILGSASVIDGNSTDPTTIPMWVQ